MTSENETTAFLTIRKLLLKVPFIKRTVFLTF